MMRLNIPLHNTENYETKCVFSSKALKIMRLVITLHNIENDVARWSPPLIHSRQIAGQWNLFSPKFSLLVPDGYTPSPSHLPLSRLLGSPSDPQLSEKKPNSEWVFCPVPLLPPKLRSPEAATPPATVDYYHLNERETIWIIRTQG
jgi:hypothetical protein